MSRHLENERNRLRTALGDILKWVDDNVRPGSAGIDLRGRGDAPTGSPPPSPGRSEQPAASRPADSGAGRATSARSGPTGAMSESPPGVITRTATTDAPLPL